MNSTRTRRALGAAAATAAAALSVGTLAAPAHAADHALRIRVGSPVQIPVEPTTPRPQLGDNVDLRIGRTGTGPVLGTRIALDVSGLDGVATLTTGERCTTAATVITCDVGYLDSDDARATAVTVTAGGELADTGSPAAVPPAWASAAALALGTGAVLAARRPGRRRA
ncbi:hypothetical protein PUR61_44125 [Streptomyces sp. BE20]|uniref:hypothetical protein n=1 Tax=Streptomyces sp. BE20 TaxID=3002525 RepID=UPI002E75FE1E|nr:hypothetical protein [Streptomyces sp. BE20]MEE1829106.1 hypothetical protein [Streptomyces sp. BE20]